MSQASNEQQAVKILVDLSSRRQQGRILSATEFELIDQLLQNFIDSSSLRTTLTKFQMLTVVNALLQKLENVSTKWNKPQPQLVGILMRWTQEARGLNPPTLRSKLFVEFKSFGKK